MTGFGTASRSETPPLSGDAMPEHREQQAAARIAHVAAQRDGFVGLAVVHRGMEAADVAVAQQPTPAPAEFGGVRLGIVGQFTDVSEHLLSTP